MERFFGSLKHEWTNHESFADLEGARLSVFKYIDTFYNPIRIPNPRLCLTRSIRNRKRPGYSGVKKCSARNPSVLGRRISNHVRGLFYA
jgi:hypothetical protein